jgi:hypothetical protein
MKKICVIDGQGGGMGSAIIRKLKDVFGESIEIIALGTNAVATAQMLKAGANRGASGENAISYTVKDVDFVTGPMGIVLAHALMGEVSPAIAHAVCECSAPKVLLPLSQENVKFVGILPAPLPHLVDDLVENHLKPFIGLQAG